MRGRNLLAVLGLPLLTIAVVAGWMLLVSDRLPAEVAVHWDGAGEADGFASRSSIVVLFVGISVVMTGLFAAIGNAAAGGILGRPVRGIGNGIVWFLATLMVGITVVQLDGTSTELPMWLIGLSVASGVAGWGLATTVARPQEVPASTEPARAGAPRLPTRDSDTIVWSGRTPRAGALVWLGAGVGILGVALAFVTSPWILTILGPVVALVLASSTYDITIGRGAITASGAVIGFPRVRVPLEHVESVEAGEVRAWDFGGWGVRAGAGNETAVITRSGRAIVVRRTDGAVLRISCAEPESAVASTNTLLDRRV